MPSNRVYSDNFGNNRIFKIMTNDSVTVKVTSKNLKQNKAKVTRLDDFSLHGWIFDLFFFFLFKNLFKNSSRWRAGQRIFIRLTKQLHLKVNPQLLPAMEKPTYFVNFFYDYPMRAVLIDKIINLFTV